MKKTVFALVAAGLSCISAPALAGMFDGNPFKKLPGCAGDAEMPVNHCDDTNIAYRANRGEWFKVAPKAPADEVIEIDAAKFEKGGVELDGYVYELSMKHPAAIAAAFQRAGWVLENPNGKRVRTVREVILKRSALLRAARDRGDDEARRVMDAERAKLKENKDARSLLAFAAFITPAARGVGENYAAELTSRACAPESARRGALDACLNAHGRAGWAYRIVALAMAKHLPPQTDAEMPALVKETCAGMERLIEEQKERLETIAQARAANGGKECAALDAECSVREWSRMAAVEPYIQTRELIAIRPAICPTF